MANETQNEIYYTKSYKRAFQVSAWDDILLNSNFKLSVEIMCFFFFFLFFWFQVTTSLSRRDYVDSY